MMSAPTPAQLRTMKDVHIRSKGWPVGIPAPEAMARRLVANGWCEWAPPMYRYPRPVFAVRLTTEGKVAIDMAHPGYPRNMRKMAAHPGYPRNMRKMAA